MRSTHRFAAAAATAVIGLLFFSPAAAAQGGYEAGKGSWTVRGFGAWLDTDGEPLHFRSIDQFPPVGESSFDLGDGDGMGLALEYRITRRLGVEALALVADLEGEVRSVFTDPPIPEQVVTRDVETELFALGLNLHLMPGRRIDVYLGPILAFVEYGEFRAPVVTGEATTGTAFIESSDDTALGATLGADLFLGSSGRWALSGAVRQLWSRFRKDSFFEIETDPLIATAGVAYRFGGVLEERGRP